MASNWDVINGLLGLGRTVFNNHRGVREQFFERAKNEKLIEMKSPDMITKSGLQQDHPPALPVLSFEGNISFPDYFFMPSPKLIKRSQHRSRYMLSVSVKKSQARPRRRSTSRLTSALVSSLTPLSSIFFRSRISLRPSGEGGVPGDGRTSLRVPLLFSVFFFVFINHILPPKPCPKLSYSSTRSPTSRKRGFVQGTPRRSDTSPEPPA